MPIDTSKPNPNFIWGIAAIANLLNRTPKQLYPLVAQNRIEGVTKVNGRYCKILASHGATDDDRTTELNGSA
jgi:hypothetical protein